MNLAMRNPGDIPEGKPSLENLIAHYRKFGLDREAKGYHTGKEKSYTTYKALRTDSLVEVGRAYLGEDAYLTLVELVGSPSWRKDALADWEDERK